ncbi:hypothetical protein [Blastococcus sp. SYSU D00820]
MADPSGEEVLVLPPVPLATGSLLPGTDAGDGTVPPSRRITAVEIVVSTEDGGQHRIPLVRRHDAWWPPEH